MGKHAVRSAAPVRVRRAAALVGFGVAALSVIARAEDGRALAPARIVVVAGGCESEPVDASALATALHVEMVQEGVFMVDVAAPGASALEDPSVATVRLLPTSCTAPEVPGFEIADGATGRSVRSILSIADIDRAVRPRVAALVIAERLRGSWRELASAFTARGPAAGGGGTSAAAGGAPPAVGETPPAGSGPPPGGQTLLGRPAAPTPAPAAVASSVSRPVETSPEPDLVATQPVGPADRQMQTAAPSRLPLGAAIEGRSFFGPVTGLLGVRALAVLPYSPTSPLQIDFDVGVDWGMARDVLGDVSMTLASGGVGFAVKGGRGALHFALGPRAEIGWTVVQGIPKTSGARGSTAAAALAGASVLASLFAEISVRWMAVTAIDIGAAFSGIEARSDSRPVADTAGLMLGARAGLLYAF